MASKEEEEANKQRICYPAVVTACTVSYHDSSGIEHAVDITAESLYEAAALGFEALAGAELVEARPGLATVLEITAHPPPVKHRVSVAQLRKWMDGAGKSPREAVIKKRLKERLAL